MRRRPHKKAFTVAELLIAMSITAVVGLAVASVASALSHAHGQAESLWNAIQSARTGMGRIETLLRKAKLVTGTGPDRLLCWMGDANDNREIDLDEIALIHRVADARTVQLSRVVFPETMPDELVDALNLRRRLYEWGYPDEAQQLMEEGLYDPYRSTVVLATDVEDFQVSVDAAAPFTRLVIVRMTVGPLTEQITLTSAVVLRADAVDNILLIDADHDGQLDDPVLGEQ
jgi:hypothetical protein